ncbi:hypothetical protein SVAN01_08852 [Stagonosporopsis vannaccii]|nr:hypothetical protein SVAN01_08852 [Stagonosporopsis vannaccii]
MSFQRSNIRANKSLPGPYVFENTVNCLSPKSSVMQHESSLHSDAENCNLEDLEAKLERCKISQNKDSASKRKKLLGSLRSLRSLASLHSAPSKARHYDTKSTGSPVKHTVQTKTQLSESPSLALLDFEQSPSDKPMLDLSLHERFGSESSSAVQHSSPVTVPGSARRTNSYSIVASSTELPPGTIPITPGPMQRAFDRDPANQSAWQNTSPIPFERYAPGTPDLTPLPGTTLSVGAIDEELVPLPPSMNLSAVQISQEKPEYFDIPAIEQPHADMLSGLARLKLAGKHDVACSEDNSSPRDSSAQLCTGAGGSLMQTDCGSENAKLPDAANTQYISREGARALHRKQQAEVVDNAVHALNTPQHHHALPFRRKQNKEDPQDQIRKDSIVSEDWETCSGRRSIDTTSEQMQECPSQPKSAGTSANSTTSSSSQNDKRTTSGGASPADFLYIIWNSPKKPALSTAKNNILAGHTGLYDGSGFEKDDSDSATPCEPDEGTHDVHMQSDPHLEEAPPVNFSTLGGCSGKRLSSGAAKAGNAYSEHVPGWAPLPEDEQHDDGNLEFIYRAYA